ncbi:VOC family protein [Kiloniella laminariae]|uniref:VOC family protein n=1 Tax=Kiloniella laminariae TaxID=454162 RepID=UPI000363240D|nr:VOC family protein [Kiloniella laminariae]
MQQQISVITLGVESLIRSRKFYEVGFGWKAVFENEEIIFFQMNGFVLGLWDKGSLAADTGREMTSGCGAYAVAHNVPEKNDVQAVMDRLAEAGGQIIREADTPPQGGFRGYVSDPDGHSWEIAWNPAWPIDEDGHVKFAV